MTTDTVTIPREEYERLKALDKKTDWDLVEGFKKGLKDLKAGNVKEFKKGSLLD